MDLHQRIDQLRNLRTYQKQLLRSRGRRLSSEPKENNPMNDDENLQSWSVSGSFPSSEHSEYSELYNSNSELPKFVDIGEEPLRSEQPYTNHPLSPFPVPPQEQQQRYDDGWVLWTCLPIMFLMTLLCRYLGGGGPPGEEHHRGHLIRERAQRIWAIERRKAKRREATPDERLAKIHSGVGTFEVLSKDPTTGICKLGNTNGRLVCNNEEENPQDLIEMMRIDSKASTDTADTQPLELELDSESDSGDMGHLESGGNCAKDMDQEEEEEDVCHVCLDGFRTGDRVMFAKNLSCNHVFHEECLLPWLLERRENECPSCRAMLVPEEDDDEEDVDGGGDDETEIETNLSDSDGDGDSGFTDVCVVCDLPDGAGENDFDDVEKGNATKDVTEADYENTTFFIVKGRVIAKTRNSNKGSFKSETKIQTATPAETKEISDATEAMISRPCQCRHQLTRPRAKSVTSMEVPSPLAWHSLLRTRDSEINESSDLSVPLPLRRISQSFPLDNRQRRYQSCDRTQVGFSEKNGSTEGSPHRHSQIYQYLEHIPSATDDRFYDFHAGFYDSSSGDDDDSDVDDAIRRMVHNHNGSGGTPTIIASSSIFAHSRR